MTIFCTVFVYDINLRDFVRFAFYVAFQSAGRATVERIEVQLHLALLTTTATLFQSLQYAVVFSCAGRKTISMRNAICL